MTLTELVNGLDRLDEESTIYVAEPWSPASPAVAAIEPEDGTVPPEAEGLSYCLEVDLAKDVDEAWRLHRNGAEPTAEQKCEAILYYAKEDAYLPPE